MRFSFSQQLLTRRQAVSLMAVVPLAARLRGQRPPAAAPNVRRIFPGRYHVLLLEPDGTLKAWSESLKPNSSGELGLGHNNEMQKARAYQVPGLANVVTAAANWDSSFAVLADGRILSWGAKGPGILGITPLSELEVNAFARPDTGTPTPVAVRFDAVDLSVSDEHALALTRDGTLYAWGDGKNGRLGIGPLPIIQFKTHKPAAMTYVTFPVPVPGLNNVVAVRAGADHSLALLKDGTLRAWGTNTYGQLGDGTTNHRDVPTVVPGIRTAVAIAAGAQLSVAVLADGTVMAWGINYAAQRGFGPLLGDLDPHPTPTVVPGVSNVRAISCAGHVLALTRAGTVISWGWNAYGQAGQGRSTGSAGVAPKVLGLTGVVSVTAVGGASYAVLDTGRIMTWGGSPSPLAIDGLANP
jgi:alpha-tubulin suppressor-like RCC1 family protein